MITPVKTLGTRWEQPSVAVCGVVLVSPTLSGFFRLAHNDIIEGPTAAATCSTAPLPHSTVRPHYLPLPPSLAACTAAAWAAFPAAASCWSTGCSMFGVMLEWWKPRTANAQRWSSSRYAMNAARATEELRRKTTVVAKTYAGSRQQQQAADSSRQQKKEADGNRQQQAAGQQQIAAGSSRQQTTVSSSTHDGG